MKTTKIEWIVIALSSLLLLQSCTVYQKSLSSVDNALFNQKRKKLVTTDNNVFRVKKIEKEGDNIFITTQTKTVLANKMFSYITQVYPERSQAKLQIPVEYIEGFYLKDESTSTIITIMLITLPMIALGVIVYNSLTHISFAD